MHVLKNNYAPCCYIIQKGILKIAHYSPKMLHRDCSFMNTFKETDDSTGLYIEPVNKCDSLLCGCTVFNRIQFKNELFAYCHGENMC